MGESKTHQDETRTISRRNLLRRGAVGAGAATLLPIAGVLAACAAPSSSTTTTGSKAPAVTKPANTKLVMSMSGGSYMSTWQSTIIDPFEKKTGAHVQMVSGSLSAEAAQLRTNKNNPPFDVFLGMGSDFVGLIRDGYLLPLTEQKVPSIKDVYPQFKDQWKGYASYFDYSDIGIAYDTVAVKDPPRSWKDFVDRVSAGEFGKRVFFNNLPGGVRGPEVMSMLARVLAGDPTKIDAAFEAVKKMKPYIVKFITSLNDPVTLLSNKEASIGPGWDGRTFIAKDAGAKIDWIRPKEGAVTGAPALGVVKGGNEELAYQLVDLALSAEAQSAFCEKMFYGSVNSTVKYSAKLEGRIPPANEVIVSDEAFLAKNLPQWIDRWNREIAA